VALLALDAIGTEGAEDVMHSVVNAAKGGDMRAADILLRRLWPERKVRPVLLDLPSITAPSDLAAALGSVAAGRGSRRAVTREKAPPWPVCSRRTMETVELERRIARKTHEQSPWIAD
jgi:hypothetical protein